jgi:hypothetical protein
VIDGKLDDPVWQLAVPSSIFRQKVPNDGAPATETTTLRVLYDDTAVYVAFDCPQAHVPVMQRLTRRDRWVEADAVIFDLGTRGDHKSSFEFAVNASGVLYDAIRYNDTDYSQDWDENWDAATNVTEHGWTAEFRIPMRILRFPTRPVQSWDLQASRWISALQEGDDWAYYPRTVGGEVSHYGRLDDLEGLEARTPLEFRPFIVGRLRRRDPAVGQLASGTDVWGSAGVDFKWHPTAELTLDATVNPDFAQVEADQVVLNLSTAPTYYPEKRPFFLEGIDALSTPFQLLYTRRIGRVAPIPVLRTDQTNNELLVDVPEPATIYGAAKLTGRISEHWSVATVQAVTAPSDVQVQLADGSRVSRRLDPLTSFNAVRLKRDLGDNAHVALMATAVTHAEDTERYPLLLPSANYPPPVTALCPIPVQLTPLQQTTLTVPPNGRCTNDAYVGSVDWKWRSADGDWAITGQVAGTVLENGPVRPVADGTRIHPGDVGWGAYTEVRKDGGKHWVGGAFADVESRAFAIDDLGYNTRANQITSVWDFERRDLDPFGPFLEHHIILHYSETFDFAGTRVSQPFYFFEIAKLKNFWFVNANLHYRSDRFDDREVGDGTALERRARVGTEFEVDTNPTKPVMGSVYQNVDVVPDALDMSGNAGASFKVLPQWDLDLLPTWQWSFGEPRFATYGGPGQYLFGKLDGRSIGATLRTTYTFMPRLTLQAYAQLFLASGHYSDISQFQSNAAGPRPLVHVTSLTPYGGALQRNPDFEQGVLNINVVLRWEYMLGSILYVVYTRAQVPTTVLGSTDVGTLNLGAVGRAPTSDAVLVKLSYWWGP